MFYTILTILHIIVVFASIKLLVILPVSLFVSSEINPLGFVSSMGMMLGASIKLISLSAICYQKSSIGDTSNTLILIYYFGNKTPLLAVYIYSTEKVPLNI